MRITKLATELPRVLHEVLAEGGEVPLVVEAGVAVPNAQLIGLGRQVQADEELDIEGVDLRVHPIPVQGGPQNVVVDELAAQLLLAVEVLVPHPQTTPLHAHPDPLLEGIGQHRLDQDRIAPGDVADQALLTHHVPGVEPVLYAVLFHQPPRQGRLHDPPQEHAVDEGVLLTQISLDEVIYAAQSQVVGRGGQEDEGAGRRVLSKIPGELQQGRNAAGLLSPLRQRGHHGHGVVVGLDDDDIILEDRIVPGDEPQNVPGRATLPDHAIFHVYGDRGPARQLRAQELAIILADPEAGQVERHGQELALALQIHG